MTYINKVAKFEDLAAKDVVLIRLKSALPNTRILRRLPDRKHAMLGDTITYHTDLSSWFVQKGAIGPYTGS